MWVDIVVSTIVDLEFEAGVGGVTIPDRLLGIGDESGWLVLHWLCVLTRCHIGVCCAWVPILTYSGL